MRVKLDKISVTEVEVELPEKCPECGQVIGAPGGETSLVEHQLTGSNQDLVVSGDTMEDASYDSVEDVDCAHVTGVACGKCGCVLATTEG